MLYFGKKINILTLVLSEKKFLNETKKNLQVKWAVPNIPSHAGEVYSIQHYVIKFVSDLRKVVGFLCVLWFPPPIKLTTTI